MPAVVFDSSVLITVAAGEQFHLLSFQFMNKPLIFLYVCIAGIGVVSLACSSFLAIRYGTFEAGNFNRCCYSTEDDPKTGRVICSFEFVESTEDPITRHFDMWFVGLFLVVLGAGICIVERATIEKQRGF